MADPNVKIGNNVKIQNNVSVYDGVTLEDDVFCGPSMVFTNVMNPRSHWPRKEFVRAGALVNKDILDYALIYGIPARI